MLKDPAAGSLTQLSEKFISQSVFCLFVCLFEFGFFLNGSVGVDRSNSSRFGDPK